MKQNGILNIRTYSQECDQLPNILSAIEKQGGGMTVMAAAWLDGSSGDEEEISTLVSNVKKANKEYIYGVTVGNEAVFNGMSASDVANKINEVKSKLKGFKVGTVETPNTYESSLIDASDIVVVNIHPFFAPVPASDAVENLQQQYDAFKKKAGGKDIIIGEFGWPTAGDDNGDAQPGVSDLATVVESLEKSNLKYYFFEYQDSDWKGEGAFAVESHWGIFNDKGKSKISEFHWIR